jgi:hypothetical protein
MTRRTFADIAAAEPGETLLDRFLLRMPGGRAESERKVREMGPFLKGASLSGLALSKGKHGIRIRRKAIKTA